MYDTCMDDKKRVLNTLQQAKTELKIAIYMFENKQDCLKTHLLLKSAIQKLQEANKDFLKKHLDVCLYKLYKKNYQGNKARQKIMNFFRT